MLAVTDSIRQAMSPPRALRPPDYLLSERGRLIYDCKPWRRRNLQVSKADWRQVACCRFKNQQTAAVAEYENERLPPALRRPSNLQQLAAAARAVPR